MTLTPSEHAENTALRDDASGSTVSTFRKGGSPAAATVLRSLSKKPQVEASITNDIERCLASAFDHAPVGISVVASDGQWIRVNDAYCQIVGYHRAEMLTKTFLDVTHPDDAAADVNGLDSAVASGHDSFARVKRYVSRDNNVVWVDARSEIVRNKRGDVAYTVTMLRDITEERRAEKALRDSEQLLRSIIDDSPSAISVQGPDRHYRLVNRSFEQRFGVAAEQLVGDQEPDSFLPEEIIGRNREDHYRVLQTGEALKREEEVVVDGADRVQMMHKFPLRNADLAVYAVCTVVSDITDRNRREADLRNRLEWTDRLQTAAAHDRFVLYGQPIMDLASGQIHGAELLVRLSDRRRGAIGPIPPSEFLPAAERLGLVSLIDQWVVARAVQLAVNHRVEVNVSAQTVSDPLQVARLERLVINSGAPSQNIIFEITETAVAENIDSVRSFVQRIHEIGCSFAVDDFGTGFGTFTYLKQLKVDYLKIDIEFVRDILISESDQQVVRAVMGVAEQYSMQTIAEGVEDQATLEYLANTGIDYAQGYWISRPVPVDQLWSTNTEKETE